MGLRKTNIISISVSFPCDPFASRQNFSQLGAKIHRYRPLISGEESASRPNRKTKLPILDVPYEIFGGGGASSVGSRIPRPMGEECRVEGERDIWELQAWYTDLDRDLKLHPTVSEHAS